MRKIRSGDEVIVISGKYKGKRGLVLSVLADGNKLIVEGVNLSKKAVKPNPSVDEEGGFQMKCLPIYKSKVMLYNPATNKGGKVGIRVLEDGKKVRYFKATNEDVA